MKTFKKGDRATVISRHNTDDKFSLNEEMANVGDTITIDVVDPDKLTVYCEDGHTWDIRDLDYTTTNEERIRELEKELSRLKNPTFKHGDWVVCSTTENSNTALVLFSNIDTIKATGFNYAGIWSDNSIRPHYRDSTYTHRLATREEVVSALRGEWARRCKEKGWDNPNEVKIKAHADGDSSGSMINTGSFGPTYSPDRLWTSMGRVYENGQWATPLSNEDKKLFGWDVKDHGDIVKIGCQSYTKPFLEKMKETLGYIDNNKTIGELHDEFDKTGLFNNDLPF